MNRTDDFVKAVLIGDIHFGPSTGSRPGEEIPALVLRFVETMNHEIKPDVVMEMGDRINNVDAETDSKNQSFLIERLDQGLKAPCIHVLGNHDIMCTGKPEVLNIIGRKTGMISQVIKGFKFIILDTVDPMISGCGGMVGQDQLKWLQNEMNDDESPKLVFGHHPIDSHSMKGSGVITLEVVDLIFLENKSEVRQVLETGKNFFGYFSGHMHWFSFFCSPAAPYIVNPSFTEAHPCRNNAPGMFLEMDIYTNGKIDCALHTLNPRRLLGRFTSKE
jgi:hypothetical protein